MSGPRILNDEGEEVPAREWWVFSTCLSTCELMLECRLTGAFGVVGRPTKEEWVKAYYAPGNPYRWFDESRIVIKKERRAL